MYAIHQRGSAAEKFLFFVPRNPKDFKLKKQLSSSDTCVVYIAYARPSGFPVVLKIHCKTRLSAISKHQLAREVHVHSRLDHPNILQLVWVRPLYISQENSCLHFFGAHNNPQSRNSSDARI